MALIRNTRLLAVLSVMLVVAGACSNSDAVPTSDTVATTEVDTKTDAAGYTNEELARIAEVEERARAYVAAINEGRVEDMAEIVGVSLGESDIRHFEFHAILNASGTQWNLGECDVSSVSSSMVRLECEHSYTEPVFVAVGAGESIWPFQLIGDWLKADAWVPLGADFTDALSAYRDYLKTFQPDDYPSCDPLEQIGEFSQHGGMARVPECASVMIEYSQAVIEWIEAGKPTG